MCLRVGNCGQREIYMTPLLRVQRLSTCPSPLCLSLSLVRTIAPTSMSHRTVPLSLSLSGLVLRLTHLTVKMAFEEPSELAL